MATKKVRMQVSIAGRFSADSNDFSFAEGDEVEIDAELAQKWADVGHCAILELPGVKHQPPTGSPSRFFPNSEQEKAANAKKKISKASKKNSSGR